METLTRILSDTEGTLLAIEDERDGDDSHLYYVPARPWTNITTSDEAVSHLVSVFLRFGNGFWRFVEEDLFLRAMRAQQVVSDYCSRLLVNAICAWASTYSEIDEAYATPGDYLTRGNHFFDEARRLWQLERHRPSMPTLSALMILAVDSAMRGKDVLAPTFCGAAVQVLKQLPEYGSGSTQSKTARQYARARSNLAVGVVWEELSNCTGLSRHLSTLTVKTQDLPSLDFLSDTVVYWSASGFAGRQPLAFWYNLLARERRRLACFMEELLHIVAPGNPHPPEQMLSLAASLGDRMEAWYDGLHPDLRPGPDVPVPLFEFHAQCCGLFIQLYRRAWTANFGDSGSTSIEHVSDEPDEEPDYEAAQARDNARTQFLLNARKYAYNGATVLRNFRKRYGLKICVPYVVQHAAESIFALLLDLPRGEGQDFSLAENTSPQPIETPSQAFTECFRTLLGAGMQFMLPRAITRMVVQTAVKLEIPLPLSVVQLLRVVSEVSWMSQDLERLESMWPNLALEGHGPNGIDRKTIEMGELLRRWEIADGQQKAPVSEGIVEDRGMDGDMDGGMDEEMV